MSAARIGRRLTEQLCSLHDGMDRAWRWVVPLGATTAMTDLFTILSAPVRMRDGTFAVVIGTIAGIEVKEFATSSEAKTHYRMLLACLRMVVEAPLELVIIDDETEYLPLRAKFDEEFKRRVYARPRVRPAAQTVPHSPFRKLVTRVAGFLT